MAQCRKRTRRIAGMPHRRAAGDVARIVARHVRYQQRQHPRRMGRAASRPPLTAEISLRMPLISPIGAPEARSAWVSACFSAR
jgi:hypothetical protein